MKKETIARIPGRMQQMNATIAACLGAGKIMSVSLEKSSKNVIGLDANKML